MPASPKPCWKPGKVSPTPTRGAPHESSNMQPRPFPTPSPQPPDRALLMSGTICLSLMKGGVRADRMVDVARLPGLDRVELLADGGLRIGTLVRNADLAHDPDLQHTIQPSPKRCCSGASAQLRNAATVGGNLLPADALNLYDVASACNNASPARAATRATARIGCMPFSAGARPASRPTRRISACRWLRSMPSWRSRQERPARGRAGEPTSPARRYAQQENVLEPGDLIVALRLPAEARARAACTLP